MCELVVMREYILKKEFKITIFNHSASSTKCLCLQASHHGCQGLGRWAKTWKVCLFYNNFSGITVLMPMICTFYENWHQIHYPDISEFIYSCHGDCGPCLWCVNLVKICQDQSTFLCVVGGNSKGVFSCMVELMGAFAKATYSNAFSCSCYYNILHLCFCELHLCSNNNNVLVYFVCRR